MNAVHQFVAGFSHGDAISNEARVMRQLFRSWGHASEIFCETKRILPELRAETKTIEHAPALIKPDDVVLLHLSIGSAVNDAFLHLKCRKAILYHNITPPEFFRGIQGEIARLLQLGRDQMRALAGSAGVVMADSQFNAGELTELGYRDVRVLPLLLDRNQWRIPPDRKTLGQFRDGLVNVIFVGRCAPNKRLDDLLLAFFHFQHYVEPDSRLVLVGSFSGLERYLALLRTQFKELQLRNLVFTGSIRQPELNAYFQTAHLFLCMSEHEGFCIPLLEAMAHRVPVMAYAATAVPETMDGAGVLFREKRFDMVAEMMGRIVRDEALRNAIVAGQTERLLRYEKLDLARELKSNLTPLLS
jgi:glycosyltransferase involved in cell wall biosynthesis